MQETTTSSFNKSKLQKPLILLTSAILAAVFMTISLGNIILPYSGYFSAADIIRYLLAVVVNTLMISGCAAFFANIGKFTFAEYVKWAAASGVFFHFVLAVRDAVGIMDFTYFTATFAPGLRGTLITRLPVTIICVAASVGLGALLTKRLKAVNS